MNRSAAPVLLACLWGLLSTVAAAAPVPGGSDGPSHREGVDHDATPGRRTHWSFLPVVRPAVPEPHDRTWSRNAIDRFILTGLEQAGLRPAPEADRLTWLRRVHLDLTGMPPTPGQVDAFVGDARPDACERVVDALLKSPRHGERWSQPWLDLVRYADTHGFEVNTERPHAWPYRDYVIRAINEDRPYDRFIREQIAGDASGEDAATGFLVTAAALLPGQIGADDISKRLARQDSLSEIVSNTGQTFLGLSIGCARCHDHKFDPVLQRDYYALQAFFSGVNYGDRPIRSPEAGARALEAVALQRRLAEIERQLEGFVPLAHPGPVNRRETHARENEETFPPLEARFVRFTIHDANRHPTLGLIEPCVDEFEIFTAGDTPRNVALAGGGTLVTASGSRTSEAHRLEHVNDGRYGNRHSWMSDEAGRGWLLFDLGKTERIGKVIWGRDREGVLTDRLATSYTLEAGPTLEAMTRLVSLPPLRPAVNPLRTTDRFAAVVARRLRFTITACNTLEPCLDELEVYTSGPGSRNIALANAGTRATASGTLSGSPFHRLEHINDGKYGNGHSWVSAEKGRGWVELEFPQAQRIDRVVWGRDREGEFADRLPVEYRIEVADEGGAWATVATSDDRKKFVPGEKERPTLYTGELTAGEVKEVTRLQSDQKGLEAKLAMLTGGPMVFGGVFSVPEATHRLHRGDPEQPREVVEPAVPGILGGLAMVSTAAEQKRRVALAAWIANPANPLTARVMVNRIWQGHFGIGLVETPSDFGIKGAGPSHPGLLDWLAAEFISSGWSMQHLHRLIVGSATYRQSDRIDATAQARDGDDRLLWRFPSRRLDAEMIRDSMLAVNGRLNLRMGGPGYDLFRSRGGLTGFPPVESFGEEGLRRMVYAHKVRMEPEAVFGAFDCPDAGQSAPRRRPSTSPIQALNLFNSRFTLEQSEAFAVRVRAEVGADVAVQIRWAYRLALGRGPDPDELRDARPVVDEQGLASLCRALYNSNEFLFLP